jgi:hypothetical protein
MFEARTVYVDGTLAVLFVTVLRLQALRAAQLARAS